VEETSGAARSLAEESRALAQEIAKFRLGAHAGGPVVRHGASRPARPYVVRAA
jgi:methyl-accepting chemotaxis protein